MYCVTLKWFFRHPEVRAKRASKGDGPGRASFQGGFAATSG
jgi:hypothetical protein